MVAPVSLVDRIDALLPQTQCTRCGYEGCRPYAEAIAAGQAAINRCPPGGAAGIRALADLLESPALPLDRSCGNEGPLMRAVVDESRCIGCTLCIDACPVDAIVGAARQMHSVIAAECTGCELCIAPCPMDCIRMEAVTPPRSWTRLDADRARARMLARRERLDRAQTETRPPIADESSASAPSEPTDRQATVKAAIERARMRRLAAESP
jgi:electron transport complex protein RnfB